MKYRFLLALLILCVAISSTEAGPLRRIRERIQERRIEKKSPKVACPCHQVAQPVLQTPEGLKLYTVPLVNCPDGKCPLPKK